MSVPSFSGHCSHYHPAHSIYTAKNRGPPSTSEALYPDYDPDIVLQEISQVVPFFAGVKWNELGDNGKQWPVLKDGTDTEILHTKNFAKRKKGNSDLTPFGKQKRLCSTEKNIRISLLPTVNSSIIIVAQ